MAWRITKDLLYEECAEPERFGAKSRVGYGEMHSRVPVMAVVALGAESEPLPGWPLKEIKFRLYDDDDELYYQGKLHDDPECLNQIAALNWAEGDSGCTIIRVKRNGKWIVEIS